MFFICINKFFLISNRLFSFELAHITCFIIIIILHMNMNERMKTITGVYCYATEILTLICSLFASLDIH